MSKVHASVLAMLVAFFSAQVLSTSKGLAAAQLASGVKTTEEAVNLSRVKPLRPLLYFERCCTPRDSD